MTSSRRLITLCIFIALALAIAPKPASASQPLTVSSPDGRLVVSLALKALPQPYLPGERAYYQVSYQGRPVILRFAARASISSGPGRWTRISRSSPTERQAADSTWENAFGARRHGPGPLQPTDRVAARNQGARAPRRRGLPRLRRRRRLPLRPAQAGGARQVRPAGREHRILFRPRRLRLGPEHGPLQHP